MVTAEEILKNYSTSIQDWGEGYSQSDMEDAINDALTAARKEAIEDCIELLSGSTIAELRNEFNNLLKEIK